MIHTTKLRKFFPVISILCASIITGGCNETFQPVAENDRVHFSIYGALDASAETQKVRVSPLRTSTLPDPDPAVALVTLEHLGSGQKAVLRDSLYSYGSGTIFYARNYLTDMDLQPEETYRLVAEYADGRMSEATVTLPGDFPDPVYDLICSAFTLDAIGLAIEGVSNLVAVTANYYYTDLSASNPRPDKLSVQQYNNVRQRSDGSYYVRVEFRDNLVDHLAVNGSISHIRVDRIGVFIANAGPDWPDVEGLSVDEQVIPEVANNVENGLGFLAGIVSKTLSFKNSCDQG